MQPADAQTAGREAARTVAGIKVACKAALALVWHWMHSSLVLMRVKRTLCQTGEHMHPASSHWQGGPGMLPMGSPWASGHDVSLPSRGLPAVRGLRRSQGLCLSQSQRSVAAPPRTCSSALSIFLSSTDPAQLRSARMSGPSARTWRRPWAPMVGAYPFDVYL